MAKRIKHILAAAAGTICLLIYIVTLSPSVGFMDSGELAAVVYSFGIPHPTGYPLYLVLGYIISHLPLGPNVIFRLNLFSAVTSAAAVIIFYYAACSLLFIYNVQKKHKKSEDKKTKVLTINENTIYYTAFIAAVCFGLSKTLWANAVINEVYGLHTFFLCLIIYFTLRIYSNMQNTSLKLWMLLFLSVGISFSNHLTTVFVIPAILYTVYLSYKASPANSKKILLYLPFVIPGFLVYGILMIASAPGPFFNWSEPVSFSNLLYHASGGDFGHLLKSGSGLFSKNIKAFGSGFFGEFAIGTAIAGLLGLFFLYLRKKEIFIILILLIISSLGFALNYNVRDIQNYFILLYIAVAISASAGIFEILKYFAGKQKLLTVPFYYAAIIAVMLIGAGAAYNYESNNNSKNYVIEDFTLNIINNLEPGAIYITYDWGYSYPASLYYQQVEGKRQDVKFLMIKFLAAPWYLHTLKKYYPDVYSGFFREADDYISTYDPEDARNSVKLSNLIRALVKNNISKFPFYVSSDMMYNKDLPNLFSEYGWKPGPLCYKIIPKSEQYDNSAGNQTLDFNFRPFNSDDQEKRVVKVSTAGIYFDFAIYHFNNNNKQAALNFVNKSLMYENLPDALKLKNQLIYNQKK